MKKAVQIIKSNLNKKNLLILIAAFVVIGIATLLYSRASTLPLTYYVDCASGADTNSGTSQSSAWKSLAKASAANLTAGDSLLLKRGCTWNETLTAGWVGTATSPVTIGAYGEGELPVVTTSVNGKEIVKVSGSYITIENLFARAQAPETDPNCQNNPKGYIVGFSFVSGAKFNTLKNSKASGGYAGVFVKGGSTNNRIINNQIVDNVMMNPLDTAADNDAGAFGVLLHGDDNEVANNEINGHYACSYDYNGDGAAIELYGGQRNNIHHNKASGNEAFTELGNSRTTGTTYAYNLVTSDITTSTFLITRGAASSFGPVANTKAYNNTVYLTGSSSQGVVCHAGCGTSILSLKNNILWANWKAIYADAAFDESNNIYWKSGGNPLVQATISSNSKKADPLFTDLANKNFHLSANSPAINAGANLNYVTDLDNKQVPSGGNPDIGAYEYGSDSPPPPSVAADSTPPTVTITSPADASAVSARATVNIAANSNDDVQVTKVEFYVNGVLTCTDNSAAYTCGWKVPGAKNKSYTISVIAYDSAGNTATHTIRVNAK